MIDLEKVKRAKQYIEKMAYGRNPLSGESVPDTDIINNVCISRCLFYVSEVLEQVIEEQESDSKNQEVNFPLPLDQLKNYVPSEEPLSISAITGRINTIAALPEGQKVKREQITDWLMEIGALQGFTTAGGACVKRPTQQGIQLGITTEKRTAGGREYDVVVYDQYAQQFIADHLDAIMEFGQKSPSDSGHQGDPWTAEQEGQLVELFYRDLSIPQIAKIMKRTKNAIRARLKKLELLKNGMRE